MKSLKTLSLILGACVSFYACTDLDEVLVGEITEAYSEQNPAATSGAAGGSSDALGGPYSKLRDGSAGHGGIFSLQTLSSDEAWIATKGGDWYDGGILIDLHKHNFLANNAFITGTWNQQYGAINAINEALAASPDADGEKQLRVLRAFFYQRLLDIYGNVKLVVAPNTDVAQSSRSEVFDFVESELLAALGLTRAGIIAGDAPASFGSNQNPYRVSEFGAMGLLSKLYLNAEVYTGTAMYEAAHAAADYVVENGTMYSLATAESYSVASAGRTSNFSVPNLGRLNPNSVPDREEGNIYTYEELEGYAAMFAANNESNPEFIWSIEYDDVTAGGMNFSMMTLHYGSQFTWNFTAQPWNGYASLEEFYNSYDDSDKRKESNFIEGEQTDFNGLNLNDYAADDPDILLNYTAANTGGIYPNGTREAGARLGKFSMKQFGRDNMSNDYPIIRLGDMYLVRAEANARLNNNWSLALDDVNIIRRRAGAADLTSLDADSFLAERGREMFQESNRRTDQIRFNKWRAGTDSGTGSANSPAFKNLMPIPLDAINASEGTLNQNSGY